MVVSLAYLSASQIKPIVPETSLGTTVTFLPNPCRDHDHILEVVKKKLGDARHCESNEDCTLTSLRCPLGCAAVVNVTKAQEIQQLLAKIPTTCESCRYRCGPAPNKIFCDKGSCKAVHVNEIYQPPEHLLDYTY